MKITPTLGNFPTSSLRKNTHKFEITPVFGTKFTSQHFASKDRLRLCLEIGSSARERPTLGRSLPGVFWRPSPSTGTDKPPGEAEQRETGVWDLGGRDESERQRAESQRIVAARPLCPLQYPVAYLSRLQRILPAARWNCTSRRPARLFRRDGLANDACPWGPEGPYCGSAIGRRAHASL